MDELGRPPRPGDLSRSPGAPSQARPAIVPLLAGYWSFGQYWGVWVILVFEFQERHGHMSDSRLGVLYTLLSIVAVLVMLLIAPRLQPLPLRASVPLALASLAVGAAAIGYLPTSKIWLGFALVGVGNALIDIYLNVAAQRAEVITRRPVLQWLHASYALGGVTGAAMTGLILASGLDFRLGLAYAGVCLFSTAVWNARTAPRERPPVGAQTAFSISAIFRSPALWVPALAVLFAFLVEGSMDVWSGLYLRSQLHASAWAASIAFVAFSGAIFFGRLFAGRVLFNLGPRITIITSGIGAACAGLLAVLTSDPWLVGLAYLLLGFSISAAAPAAFGLVETIDEDPAHAIAAVTTVGYTGFIWSPPLLGYIAQTVSLRAAMSVIVVATLGIVATGLMTKRA
jgi:predicted MFS family arabinose efflux permease